jgi:hypothetical protein
VDEQADYQNANCNANKQVGYESKFIGGYDTVVQIFAARIDISAKS